jgi:hypothetical protein
MPTYLEVTVHGNLSDARTDDIVGDLSANGQVLANWGLHLVDADLATGNLVDIVGRQAQAYLSRRTVAAQWPLDGETVSP